VREGAGVQHRQQARELGVLDVLGEGLVVARLQRVPPVLVAERHDELVEERVRQT
jgi:hypothetical protein